MHHPQVKAGGPVGIFFSEKIHCSNINKKKRVPVSRNPLSKILLIQPIQLFLNSTRRFNTRPSSVELSAIG